MRCSIEGVFGRAFATDGLDGVRAVVTAMASDAGNYGIVLSVLGRNDISDERKKLLIAKCVPSYGRPELVECFKRAGFEAYRRLLSSPGKRRIERSEPDENLVAALVDREFCGKVEEAKDGSMLVNAKISKKDASVYASKKPVIKGKRKVV